MSMIAQKVKPKIIKAINKMPTEAIVKRVGVNEFGEPSDEENIVCNVIGLYHEGSSSISQITKDKGIVIKDKEQYLMVVCDEDTVKIKQGDFMYLDNNKFIIQDLGNQNRMNIYFDLKLGKVR
ncbi:hypothetical protein CDFC105_41551 [Clostridioides difficile]|nr:hypothetical protein QUA_1633 [Clostridioides difficile P49]ERM51306.1 hypothetical protein QUG_3676 [Clostridioides difficile P53]CCL06846.1 conserved hypothetical protein [Clostridioides difficile CD002]CZR78502.1 hypothetical protein CDFC105_41551 [Clostridioides difficile]CZT58710.1 hypothetical protein CDFC105_101567 [Clostridioides difficile]